jgi:hypothetical protein
MSSDVVARWRATMDAVHEAAVRSGREPSAVRVVAVSKRHPATAIAAVHAAGQVIFGENYVQEARAKMRELPATIEWHLVGHVQTNKVRQVVGSFALLHGVDSVHLAHALQERAQRQKVIQPVLMQVNLGRERQKSGVLEEDLPELAETLIAAPNLAWQGLMLLPPVFDDPEAARPFFAALRDLRDRLEQQYGVRLPELSMGMTGDFAAAIAEGATLVRIGTRIFGERA